MMRPSKGPVVACGIFLMFLALISSCSNSTDYTGAQPQIEDSKAVLVFRDTGVEPEVIFTHRDHSEYWEGDCLSCHNHTDVRDDTIWGCGQTQCHVLSSSSGLCYDTTDHGTNCMSAQCTQCHDLEPLAPQSANCSGCHISLITGLFLDSAVEGLKYETASQKDRRTGSSGDFQFRSGEVITFSVNSIVLGSSTALGTLTPVDLVPGATDETDTTVLNMARFLMSLDDDGDPDNGIRILDQVHIAAQGRNIPFDVSSSAFGTNPDLVGSGGLLQALNSVFTANTPRSLVLAPTAQAHLGSVLDSVFPSSTRIVGAPNTGFLLYGSHAVSGGTSYQYQWYRADDNTGTGIATILSATAQTYQPMDPDDVGKYLSFEVIPSAGGSMGTSSRSGMIGPMTDSSTKQLTVYNTFLASSDVHSYDFMVSPAGTVKIDVETYEPSGYSGSPSHWHNSGVSYSTCNGMGCHLMDGPADLGLPDPSSSNGSYNDYMMANIYLFDDLGILKGSKDCDPCGITYRYSSCEPGCDAPDAYVTRNGANPYLSVSLGTGDHTLKIGAAPLSEANARADFNTQGWFFWQGSNEHYKITFTFP